MNRIEEKKRLHWSYVIVDLVAVNISFLLFDVFRHNFLPSNVGMPMADYLLSPKVLFEQILIGPCMLALYWVSGYYNNVLDKSRLQELFQTVTCGFIAALLLYAAMLLNDKMGRRREDYELFFVLFGLLFAIPYIGRLAITSYTIWRFKHKNLHYRTVVVGRQREARAMARRLQADPRTARHEVVDILPMEPEAVAALADRKDIDVVVLAVKQHNESRVMETLFKLFPMNIPVKISPDNVTFMTSAIRLNDVYGEPLIDLSTPRLSESSKNIKRVVDVMASALALVVLSPVMTLFALLIKAGSKGPVFYSQERIGRHHKPFKIYKFRSMTVEAEAAGPQLSSDSDPRVTPIGRVMRKYRIDELPQFWNVIKGDMSLVGPRPERAYFIRQIVKRVPYYTLLHQVRPGITSWGMVKYGYAKNIDEMVKRSKFDIIYLSNMSLAMDLKIMIHTVKTIITGKGV